jgi:hypothetical protein
MIAGCPSTRAEGCCGCNQEDWFHVFTVAQFSRFWYSKAEYLV